MSVNLKKDSEALLHYTLKTLLLGEENNSNGKL